jgi:hypothetical protein
MPWVPRTTHIFNEEWINVCSMPWFFDGCTTCESRRSERQRKQPETRRRFRIVKMGKSVMRPRSVGIAGRSEEYRVLERSPLGWELIVVEKDGVVDLETRRTVEAEWLD